MPGVNISPVEVSAASRYGFWLLLEEDEELFVPFSDFPWFRSASLAACRTLGSDSEKWPRRGHFLTISPGNGRTIAQEMGEKGAGAVALQPEIPKSDRLLEQLFHVERPQSHHLYWPELDIDLHLDSIRHPEKFPLISQAH